jgi:hypothetical protein
VGTQICFQIDSIVGPSTKILTNYWMLWDKKAKNAKWGGEKLRVWDSLGLEDLWNWFGRFTKLLEVKVHYHEIEVCHMSSRFRRIMNYFRRFMKLVESWSGEFCAKIGTFPTFYKLKRFGFFFFLLGSYWELIFSRLNSKIYLYHLVIFLISRFYFGIF